MKGMKMVGKHTKTDSPEHATYYPSFPLSPIIALFALKTNNNRGVKLLHLMCYRFSTSPTIIFKWMIFSQLFVMLIRLK